MELSSMVSLYHVMLTTKLDCQRLRTPPFYKHKYQYLEGTLLFKETSSVDNTSYLITSLAIDFSSGLQCQAYFSSHVAGIRPNPEKICCQWNSHTSFADVYGSYWEICTFVERVHGWISWYWVFLFFSFLFTFDIIITTFLYSLYSFLTFPYIPHHLQIHYLFFSLNVIAKI